MSLAARAFIAGLLLVVLASPLPALEPAHLPDSTEVIFTINLRQILDSPVARANKPLVEKIRFMADTYLTDLGIQQYLEKSDFDLFRDLRTLTLCTAGDKTPDLVVLEGRFNAAKLLAAANEASKDNAENVKATQIDGRPVFEVRTAPEAKPLYVGLAGTDRLIATSSKNGFVDALARLAGTKQSNLKKEMRDRVGPALAKQSLAIVATGPALAKLVDGASVPSAETLQEFLKGIAVLNLNLAVDKNMSFELGITAKDKQSAEDMNRLTSVVLAAVRLMVKKKAEADPKYAPGLDIVNSLRVTGQDSTMILRGEVTAEVLARLLKDAK
jgi:hypothetical protein